MRMMPPVRTQVHPAALGIFLSLSACGIDQFDDTIVDETTIPAASFTQSLFSPPFGAGLSNLDLSKSQSFENNGVTPSDVDSITVKSIRLEVSTGSANLDRIDVYLSKVTFWVEAPGQARQVIGEKSVFPMAAAVDLEIPKVELKPYATAAAMTVGADLTPKTQPAVNVKLKSTITIHVDVNLAGI